MKYILFLLLPGIVGCDIGSKGGPRIVVPMGEFQCYFYAYHPLQAIDTLADCICLNIDPKGSCLSSL